MVLARPGVAWLAMAAALCIGAVLVERTASPAGLVALEWQPGWALAEPWRLWTAAWVHWSVAHLAVNLAGAAVVGAVGWRARLPGRAALAWFVAWPLTHLLMAAPGAARVAAAMQHYGGLSGVLHAGAIVLGLTIAWPGTSRDDGLVPLAAAEAARHRWIGLAVVAGTWVKVGLETPWNLALRPDPALGIAVAPLAHAGGIAAGVLAWAALVAWRRPGRGPGRRAPR